MNYKNFTLIIILFCFVANTYAQGRIIRTSYDSSVIPAKRLNQQSKFLNNKYEFPARPRNSWEVGVSIGSPNISGDVATKFPAFGFEAHVRKALGYLFSLRLQYVNGVAKGQSWKSSENNAYDPVWNKHYNQNWRRLSDGKLGTIIFDGTPGGKFQSTKAADNIFTNYKTKIQSLELQGIFTINNLRFHKQKSSFILYGGGGIGFTWYQAWVNALDQNYKPYTTQFNKIQRNIVYGDKSYKNRREIIKSLKDVMDDTYESRAENSGERRPKIGNNTIKPSGTVLVGVAYRISKRINLALEDRHTFVKDDLLDGQQWQEHGVGDPVHTRDHDSWNFFSIGLNFNLGAKAVEPLWWINPLDYAYANIRIQPKILPVDCEDTDGDGVCDFQDKEPNTPLGCPVDTRGISRDTDGDGVIDCKDKQLITPTECQPVDDEGVGHCPDPECCKSKPEESSCPESYPSIKMDKLLLDREAKTNLASIAAKLKEKAPCKILLIAHPGTSKSAQSLAQNKLNLVKKYLQEKLGISEDRITTSSDSDTGNEDTIEVKSN